MDNDFSLPPSQNASGLERSVASRRVPDAGTAAPSPVKADPPAPRDEVQLAPFLQGGEKGGIAQQIQEIAQQPIPLSGKLERFARALEQSTDPLHRRGEKGKLDELYIAAEETLGKLLNAELQRAVIEPGLSAGDRQQRLQQLQQHLEENDWLSDSFRSTFQTHVKLAEIDLNH